MAKLKELGAIITGNTPKTSDLNNYSSNDICFVKPSDIKDDEIIYIDDTEFYIAEYAREKSRMLPVNSILVTCIGIIGKIAINNIECAFNQQINAIIPNTEICNPKYLAYAIQSQKKYMQDIANAPVVPILNKTQFSEIDIKICSMEEQQQIVTTLDKVSDLIDKRKEQLNKLDELVKARFDEMFGDLKANPYNWECKNLLDVADIDTVMVSDYKKYAHYPHIGIDSIEKNTGRLFGYRTIAEDGVISGKYLFTTKHIIYSKIRPNLNKVALPDFEGLCSADAYPILPKENICLREYLGYVMRSEFFLDYILPFSRRANMPKVNKEQLSGFSLPVPPIEIQNEFAVFLQQTEKLKFEVKQGLEKLETLKKSLMQQYFG